MLQWTGNVDDKLCSQVDFDYQDECYARAGMTRNQYFGHVLYNVQKVA